MSKTGKLVSTKVGRWFEDKGYGFIDAKGVDVSAHSTCVKRTKGIIGAVVSVKVIEDLTREKGKYKAVEVKREYDYIEDVAQKNWRRRRQRR